MSEQKKPSSYKDLLAGIEELNRKETSDIHIISMKKTFPFKPLSVKQQKKIMSAGVDTDIESLSFANVLNEIIAENCINTGVSILVTDRPFILLQLRACSMGGELVVTEDDKEYKIDLNKHIKDCLIKVRDGSSANFEVKVDEVKIKCTVPTIGDDTTINKQFTKKAKKSKTDESPLELTDVIGDLYVHEIVKYLKEISVGEHVVNLNEGVSVHQKLEVFESLPMRVSNEISKKVRTARKLSDSVLEHESLPDDTTLPLDATLFTVQD